MTTTNQSVFFIVTWTTEDAPENNPPTLIMASNERADDYRAALRLHVAKLDAIARKNDTGYYNDDWEDFMQFSEDFMGPLADENGIGPCGHMWVVIDEAGCIQHNIMEI